MSVAGKLRECAGKFIGANVPARGVVQVRAIKLTALTRNVLLALIPFEQGQPLAHFFEHYHRHPRHALRLLLKAVPVL